MPSQRLRSLLARAAAKYWTFREVLRQAALLGFPLVEVLAAVDPEDGEIHFDPATGHLSLEPYEAGDDWFAALAEHAGGLDEAQAALDAAARRADWHGAPRVALRRRLADRSFLERLERAVDDGIRLVDLARVLEDPRVEHADAWWRRACAGRELRELFTVAVPEHVVDSIIAQRGGDFAAAAGLPFHAERVRRWAERRLGRALPADAGQARTTALAALARVESRSLWDAVVLVEGEQVLGAWLPILRAAGFDGHGAALAGLEAGLAPLAVAVAMAEAGYSDARVLDGLVHAGVGHDPAVLAMQRAAGRWRRWQGRCGTRGTPRP